MSPRTDEYEDNNSLSATSDEDDDGGLKDDMAALARACRFTADEDENVEDPLLSAGDAIVPFTATATANEDSDSDDLECLKRVQSLYKPTGNSVPSPVPMIPDAAADDEDDEDDFETVRAIFKRFSAYDGGRLSNICYKILQFFF